MDKLILDCVSESPQNKSRAFELAANYLNQLQSKHFITAQKVSGRYYSSLMKKEQNIALVSKSGVLVQGNYKNVARSTSQDVLDVILPKLSKAERKELLTQLLKEFLN